MGQSGSSLYANCNNLVDFGYYYPYVYDTNADEQTCIAVNNYGQTESDSSYWPSDTTITQSTLYLNYSNNAVSLCGTSTNTACPTSNPPGLTAALYIVLTLLYYCGGSGNAECYSMLVTDSQSSYTDSTFSADSMYQAQFVSNTHIHHIHYIYYIY